ncbi:MAG: NapC/NirT family cytochrome c [Planctomycetia bacterium]|nr:NapC/NirT family cytochrome c [Planctomycetia bacterium]
MSDESRTPDIPPAAPPPVPPVASRQGVFYLAQNLISLMGFLGAFCFGLVLLVRVGMDVAGYGANGSAYQGLVTYILLPGFFTASLVFAGIGMFLKWRVTRKHGLQVGILPGMNPRRRYMALATAAGATCGWLLLSLFGTYKAYQYTESTAFCGLACHQVMEPEYMAYLQSPHAKVSCVECHIGPGADWFVKSKITGMGQLWAVTVKSYKTPIKTPVHNLRPAQDTCEHCHWPERFSGSVERIITHFSKDEANTPTRYHLLMKVGGGHADKGKVGGAHWHVSNEWTVQYLPLDERRQDIPYVRVKYKDGRVEEFARPGFDRTTLDERRLLKMDCLDCHTRPSHIFKSANRLLNEAMAKDQISPSLPGIKKTAEELLEAAYKTKADAFKAIDAGLDAYAKERALTADQQALLASARPHLRRLYESNYFPEHGVDHRAFVDNLGHFEFKGCERCHDGKHKNAEGTKAISHECANCHLIVGQARGAAEMGKLEYGLCEFEHPEDPVSLKKTCSSCHARDK